MDKNKFIAILKMIATKNDVEQNIAMLYFFTEQILKRISSSNYFKNLILKGGFLLSNMIGLDKRTTVDIDFLAKNLDINEDKLKGIFNEFLAGDDEHGITFEVSDVKPIRKSTLEGGFKISIICRFEWVKQVIHIDVAKGIGVIPEEIEYQYKSNFEDGYILLIAYPIEAMISEKLSAVRENQLFNTRNKDYLDLFIYDNLLWERVDIEKLWLACSSVFEKANIPLQESDYLDLIDKLRKDKVRNDSWSYYVNKNLKVKLSFGEVLDSVQNIITKLFNR